MKIKIVVITLILLFIFSCKEEEPKPIHLDVAKLKEMKAKWQGLNIKNYSFTYVFDRWQPRLHTGYVKVENGVGNVVFDLKYGYVPDISDEKEKLFYITSMDEVFDNILNMYLLDKKRWENGKLDYFDYGDFGHGVKYNPSNFFPEKMSVSYDKPGSGMISGGGITLTITDFKVLE